MGVWEITLKDLRLILKDRGALYTLLALPVVFIAILGVSTGELFSKHDEGKLLKIGMVDESGGELSQQLFENLAAIGGIKVGKIDNRAEGKRQLQDGRSGVVVIVGKEFEDRVEDLKMTDIFNTHRGKLAKGLDGIDLHVESGVEFVGAMDLVEYVVLSAVMRVVAPEVAKRNPVVRRMMDRAAEGEDEEGKSVDAEVKPATEPVKAGPSIIYQTLVPAFMVMFAFFLINIMASSFINERKIGTLKRLKTSPITSLQLLWGKTLPFLFVSIAQSILLFLSGKLMFGMSWGTYPFMLMPVILATSVSAAGLGLLLATIVRTESQVSSYSTFLVIVLAGISGCYMPRAWLPEIMQNVSLATPHAWALIAYQELLTREQPKMLIVGQCVGMLLIYGITYFAIGCRRFRRIEYQQ